MDKKQEGETESKRDKGRGKIKETERDSEQKRQRERGIRREKQTDRHRKTDRQDKDTQKDGGSVTERIKYNIAQQFHIIQILTSFNYLTFWG